MVKDILSELNSFLIGLAIYGLNTVRETDKKELEKLIQKVEMIGMDNLKSELEDFKVLMNKSIHSIEDVSEQLVEKYYVICGYGFIGESV
ncbi:hypothetical protein [Oceanirhabdus sp. W0125-5]|uniref:hypothetical protein n=1 Tax=Oceanirhabdus sp. W0125-5 TaxID=2999116 RepID=UPI0022F30FAA|nr:hypothetical protein [Oceanirhabdus sp. W0125-5]WBW96979.1 hypothetical protein OW730_25310 [Oceanirhabdus sp. W0125-5]